MTHLLKLFFLLCLTSHLFANDPQTQEAWFQANQAYQQQEFEEAYQRYQRLLSSFPNHGSLHYNLGNTAFRLGNLGASIGHYLQAKETLPRNEDLQANLQYARSKVLDQKETSPLNFIQKAAQWTQVASFQEWTWAFLGTQLFFWILLWAYRLFPQHWLLGGWICVLSITLLMATGMFLRGWWTPNIGVILTEKTTIRSAPNEVGTSLFELNPGTEVLIEAESGNWLKVAFSQQKRGWVLKNHLFGRL